MAAHNFLLVAAFLLCSFYSGCCQDIAGPTQITISPTSLVMSPNVSGTTGGQVTITCRPSSAGAGEQLVGMTIQRVLHTNPNAPPVALATARVSSNNGNAALTLPILQASVSASVSGSVSQRVITLTLNSANCGDGGMYICTATTLTADFQTRLYSSSANVTILVSPGEIMMIAEPSGTTNWRVNDTLLMRCNGIVGTVVDESQIEWVWEYQDGTLGYDNWQSYAGIGNPDTDINNRGFVGFSNCYKYQISKLTRHLTLDDTGRQYRCYVINRDVGSYGPGAYDAPVYSVGTVTGKAKGDKQATCRCPDAGAIIGAAVAVIVVIDVVILAVVIILFRRRMQEAAKSMSQAGRGLNTACQSLSMARQRTEVVL